MHLIIVSTQEVSQAVRIFGSGCGYGWNLITAAVWLYVSSRAIQDPTENFGMGLVQATGRSALWFTAPAALVAVMGCLLMWRKRPRGTALLLGYGLFWCAALAGGAVRDLVQHCCGRGEYQSPELATLVIVQIVLAGLFLLAGIWAWRRRAVSA